MFIASDVGTYLNVEIMVNPADTEWIDSFSCEECVGVTHFESKIEKISFFSSAPDYVVELIPVRTP